MPFKYPIFFLSLSLLIPASFIACESEPPPKTQISIDLTSESSEQQIPHPEPLPEKYLKATISSYVEQTVTARPIPEPIEIIKTVIVEKIIEKIIEKTVVIEKFVEVPVSVVITATPTITPTPENTPTATPTQYPTPLPTPTYTPIPTSTPLPTSTPTPEFTINPGTTPKSTAGGTLALVNSRVVRPDNVSDFSGFSAEVRWVDGGNWESLPIVAADGKINANHVYSTIGVHQITIKVTVGNTSKLIQFNALIN